MNDKTANSRSINDSARCQHRTATGKRCRLRVTDTSSGLCFQHASRGLHLLDSADLRSALAGELTEFNSAADINGFLSRLLLHLAENRVGARRAAVLAYISNLLLRTLPAIDAEESMEQVAGPHIILDLPRPNRDPEMQPS
jgi:hypothetical protein